MLRLPRFTYLEPRTLGDAIRMRADAGDDASFVAGGTDLYPNMKRRQQTPHTVIALHHLRELQSVTGSPREGMTIGAGVTLTALARSGPLRLVRGLVPRRGTTHAVLSIRDPGPALTTLSKLVPQRPGSRL